LKKATESFGTPSVAKKDHFYIKKNNNGKEYPLRCPAFLGESPFTFGLSFFFNPFYSLKLRSHYEKSFTHQTHGYCLGTATRLQAVLIT
jgi:hypothetical protein